MNETVKNPEVPETAETAPQQERKNVLKLRKPYKFEGQEYPEIDLSGLDKLTIADAVDAQKKCQGEIAAAALCETTTAFAREIAVKATGLPVEFFKLLPRGVSRQVVRMVQGYLNVESNTENHIMRLEKPYYADGEYTEIDLSGAADLTSLNESAAENEVAREGFAILEPTTNYVYICCIAGMAAGKRKDFFTGLPLRELVKLRNAVNDAGFFE